MNYISCVSPTQFKESMESYLDINGTKFSTTVVEQWNPTDVKTFFGLSFKVSKVTIKSFNYVGECFEKATIDSKKLFQDRDSVRYCLESNLFKISDISRIFKVIEYLQSYSIYQSSGVLGDIRKPTVKRVQAEPNDFQDVPEPKSFQPQKIVVSEQVTPVIPMEIQLIESILLALDPMRSITDE